MLIYRLKSNKTGLFSKGGSTPSFSKTGKIWKNIGHLKNHINQLGRHGRQIYQDKDVVLITSEVVETEIDVTSFDDLLADSVKRKEQKEADRRSRLNMQREAQERKQYEQLKKKFG